MQFHLPLLLSLLTTLYPAFTTAQAAAGGGAPVALPTAPVQDSTIRMAPSLFTAGGVTSARDILFTQTFATTALGTWALGPSPKPGMIGLGDIQGAVGSVKEGTGKKEEKRSEVTGNVNGNERRWEVPIPMPTRWGF